MPSLLSPLKSQSRDPWQIGAIFFSIQLFPFSPSLWGYHKSSPCTLSPVLSFLTPPPLSCPSIHELFFSLFNSLLSGCRSDLGSILQLPSHFHPHSSLGNVDLFPTSSSRSKASGDHQQSSAKKEKKMCGNSQDGKEPRPLIVFSFFFPTGKKTSVLWTVPLFILQWTRFYFYFFYSEWLIAFCNVTRALMFLNPLHATQIVHINSVFCNINQAALKSENSALPVFIHSVTCLYQQLE